MEYMQVEKYELSKLCQQSKTLMENVFSTFVLIQHNTYAFTERALHAVEVVRKLRVN